MKGWSSSSVLSAVLLGAGVTLTLLMVGNALPGLGVGPGEGCLWVGRGCGGGMEDLLSASRCAMKGFMAVLMAIVIMEASRGSPWGAVCWRVWVWPGFPLVLLFGMAGVGS